MLTRSEALQALKLKSDPTDEQIKRAYRELARQHHPDKGGDPEEFRKINEAYEFLTKLTGEEALELAASWMDIVGSDVIVDAKAVATSDQHKPTIEGFFLSLRKQLYALEEKANQAVADNKVMVEEQQRQNREYLFKAIQATREIARLLEAHIDTKKKSYWEIQESIRLMLLGLCLVKQFNEFGPDQILVIRDAYTFELAQILSNHLAYLRDPVHNFKSTEDRYYISLLSDISSDIILYHNDMLNNLKKFDV